MYDKMYWPILKIILCKEIYGKIIFFSRCFQLLKPNYAWMNTQLVLTTDEICHFYWLSHFLYHDPTAMSQAGGFKWTKWIRNSTAPLAQFPKERSKKWKSLIWINIHLSLKEH